MDQQLLLVILSSAATALAVAAVLGLLLKKTPLATGWTIGALAIALALLPAARVTLGGWPPLPPRQAVDWVLILAGTTLASVLLTGWVRRAALRGGIAGLATSAVLIAFPLARALGRMESPAIRLGWMVGLAALMTIAGAVTAAAMNNAARDGDPDASLLSRLRDRHWPTLAVGLILGIGAPAMLFATHVKKLLDLGVGLACAMAGVALAAWLITRRTNLAGASLVGILVYMSLWAVGYFYGGADPSPIAAALGAAAPIALIIGTWGPLARKGGWLRLAVVVTVSTGLAGAAAAINAGAYLQELREMQQYGG